MEVWKRTSIERLNRINGIWEDLRTVRVSGVIKKSIKDVSKFKMAKKKMNVRAVIKGVNRRKISVIGFYLFRRYSGHVFKINLKAAKITFYKFLNSVIRYYKNVNE